MNSSPHGEAIADLAARAITPRTIVTTVQFDVATRDGHGNGLTLDKLIGSILEDRSDS
ncbi:hypothetical protein ACNKF0_09240 [Nocardioides sp. T5]|uniref:hypothetical protein n=1 Tax=Nocardioides sp. T5 TaxID=3400182 RepID=UPI003A895ACC